MTYSAFINAVLANIEEQECCRKYMTSEYVVHFEYEPKKDGVYNIEFLLNVFEEAAGIQKHTIEVKAGEK